MPAKRRWIDPLTGDHVVESGGPREDDTSASAVVLRLRTKRGTMAVLPAFGSRLHKITKASTPAERLAEAYAREALGDLVRAGTIRDVRVKASTVAISGGAALTLEIAFRDTAGDQRTVRYRHQLTS